MSEPRILNSPASGRGINQLSNPPKWGGGGGGGGLRFVGS